MCSKALANDVWICQEMASERHGDIIKTCGVGEGKTESDARLMAFDSAYNEFKRVCDASEDCNVSSVGVIPKRNSCEKTKDNYKCYRMIVYKLNTFTFKRVKTVLLIKKPTYIYRGMTKNSLIDFLGKPYKVEELEENGITMYGFYYKGKQCSGKSCLIAIVDNKVAIWNNIRADYTDVLGDYNGEK